MLDNVKLSYFLKLIFSCVDEKRKLQLIKYNKSLKNKIDITILNYKLFSERYIIYTANERVKVYNSKYDGIIYEGEFLNGKKNGKGKEYYDGQLVFEGEYLNGQRNGKGKEYYNDELIYEGEYLKGKKNGKGKEYNKYDGIMYEGEFLNGKKNGKGKEYYDGELILEGKFLNGKYNGKIKKYESNKPKYVEMIPNEDEFVTIGYSTERNDEKTKKGESDKFIIEEEYLEGKKWEYKIYNEEVGQERGEGKEY